MKEKVKAKVKAKRGAANENNPHSVHPGARIGTRTLGVENSRIGVALPKTKKVVELSVFVGLLFWF